MYWICWHQFCHLTWFQVLKVTPNNNYNITRLIIISVISWEISLFISDLSQILDIQTVALKHLIIIHFSTVLEPLIYNIPVSELTCCFILIMQMSAHQHRKLERGRESAEQPSNQLLNNKKSKCSTLMFF